MNVVASKLFGWMCLVVLLLPLSAGILHAQEQVGPCPPGMSQYPSPDGVPSCGAMYDQGKTSHWVTQWGALATDFAHHAGGAAVNKPDENEAKRAAIEECVSNGGLQCRVEITYANQCVALVEGNFGHNSTRAATIDAAVEIGKKVCTESGDTNCLATYTACSLAKWLR
ncbi:DUF4189 domain-containing protein [Dyella psychrodurans]|nr:DUF4189 domain-containing protein [Dyella psychrodurans]